MKIALLILSLALLSCGQAPKRQVTIVHVPDSIRITDNQFRSHWRRSVTIHPTDVKPGDVMPKGYFNKYSKGASMMSITGWSYEYLKDKQLKILKVGTITIYK